MQKWEPGRYGWGEDIGGRGKVFRNRRLIRVTIVGLALLVVVVMIVLTIQ